MMTASAPARIASSGRATRQLRKLLLEILLAVPSAVVQSSRAMMPGRSSGDEIAVTCRMAPRLSRIASALPLMKAVIWWLDRLSPESVPTPEDDRMPPRGCRDEVEEYDASGYFFRLGSTN